MKFKPLKIPIRVQKMIHRNRMPAAEAIIYSYILDRRKVYDTDEELAARFGGSSRRIKYLLSWLEQWGFIRRETLGGDGDAPRRRLITPVKGTK